MNLDAGKKYQDNKEEFEKIVKKHISENDMPKFEKWW